MAESTAIVWFRRDLRLHDTEPLRAAAEADRLLPVYAVDPREYAERPYGSDPEFTYQKTGPHRARFVRESVLDLRESLREAGSDLVVREGRPADVVSELANAVDADAVQFQTLPTPEEAADEAAVKEALSGTNATPQRYWTHTLYHYHDLPTSPYDVQDTFTPFRKRVENEATVRDAEPVPDLPPLPAEPPDAGTLPTLQELGLDPVDPDERGVLPFRGGESAALDRLERYVWDEDRLREYKETRNGLLGQAFSSKLSAWLSQGCLSPRRVHETVREYEDERVANDSTYWLLFELVWRDFFQFQFVKHGAQQFRREGIREREDIEWQEDEPAFERWCAGETGVPFVDAAMRELTATGYQSNRARQNAASFLANDLRIDWRKGAAYFETQLVDYDPCSNYGNWAYIAGVGNDSRNRSFDVLSQAKRYDHDAEYVTTWVPELDPLPPEYAHEPWTMPPETQAEYDVHLGADYPRPIVDP